MLWAANAHLGHQLPHALHSPHSIIYSAPSSLALCRYTVLLSLSSPLSAGVRSKLLAKSHYVPARHSEFIPAFQYLLMDEHRTSGVHCVLTSLVQICFYTPQHLHRLTHAWCQNTLVFIFISFLDQVKL